MKKSRLLPKQKKILLQLGENVRLARQRRKLSTEMVAERANIGRTTLWNLEKGQANISLETLIRILGVFGMDGELAQLAQNDTLGRKLQDIELLKKQSSS